MSQNTYKLIDSGNFQKLEQVGPFRISRPSPQAVWTKRLPAKDWDRVDAFYTRYTGGDGKWTIKNPKIKKDFNIRVGPVDFVIRLTDFGHLGLFAEQKNNWQRLHDLISSQPDPSAMNVLNLFAYTGGSTLACAGAGAKVVHIDASKTSVAWARENAESSGMADRPVRWIVEDVKKFVAREIKRGSKYQGIILDPPSFGRGNKNEVWKIEEHLPVLLADLAQIAGDDLKFVLLSAHSPGYTPQAMQNMLMQTFKNSSQTFENKEMLIEQDHDFHLPSGAYSLLLRK